MRNTKTKKYLIDPLLEMNRYHDILNDIKKGDGSVSLGGSSQSQKAHMSYAILKHLNLKGVFIANNDISARKTYEDFLNFFEEGVLYFPPEEIMFHDIEAKSRDSSYERIRALHKILNGEYEIVITSPEAIGRKLIDKELFLKSIISFTVGETVDLTEISKNLVVIGYERVSVVEGEGQFAIKGGIVDIFPINSENAVRIEFFDDEIDSIRTFDVISQRSLERIEEIAILPARELIYDDKRRDEILDKISNSLNEYLKKLSKKDVEGFKEKIEEKIKGDMERFKEEYYFPGIDRYISYIIDKPSIITHYMDLEKTLFFLDEPKKFETRYESLLFENYELCKAFLEKGYLLPESFEIYVSLEYILENINKNKPVYFDILETEERVPSKLLNSYKGHFDILIDDIRKWKENKYRILVMSGGQSRGRILEENLKKEGIEANYYDEFSGEILPGQVVITGGSLQTGFEYQDIKFVIISGKDFFGEKKKKKRTFSKKNKGQKISVFTDLNINDYVVHQIYGIGKYVGIQQLEVEGIKKDYLKIRYYDGDFLYVPTNQLDLIQKYIGSEGKTPKLSKLGGNDWAKTKAKAKESLMELAEDLIKLYAKRETSKGYKYSEDTVWQKQFEDLFPYQETEDQLKCIEEIKKDMESDKPMDRLLCGDVGYGKTEVAIRAIFKAVMDGKQVAYLVPTTVLAQQQFENFKDRMKDFPVRVEVISRFKSKSDQKKIIKDTKAGIVDILIGTHRLLQKDIAFKDLGLLVIDEEQRFGVRHKERIKKMKSNVDVLTLTATPIPRTLHMSLMGIRDISIIEDPPEERYPVQTYVMEYNPEVIKEAINRELARGGQVFYLFNRVRSINVKAAQIKDLVPDARVAVAHGQMKETDLENIMLQFVEGEYDVLVCTTIIESGLDMPNVNTIIVEDADKMGLAQLYQLRGRVGRSNRLAYAYITYKKDKVLSEVAEKRLQAIKEFTEFGSGFKIAMRDLQIRGAGNLLGAQQHGNIDLVGYDMYVRLLSEAINELRGTAPEEEEVEISVDLKVSAYIDDSYIGDENQKIEMYKKIASIQDEKDMLDIRDELIDRYGEIPDAVESLIQIAHLKVLAKKCGFSSIQEKGENVILQFMENKHVDINIISKLTEKHRRRILFTASNKSYITFIVKDTPRKNLLKDIKILLQDIIELQ